MFVVCGLCGVLLSVVLYWCVMCHLCRVVVFVLLCLVFVILSLGLAWLI